MVQSTEKIFLNNTDDQKYFCYLQCQSYPQLVVESVITGLLGIIIILIIKKFYSLRKININSTTKFAFITLMLWSLCFLTKQLVNIIVYQKLKDQQNIDESFISLMSKFLFIIDFLAAFLLQYLFLLIPYHWTGGVIEYFKQMGMQYNGNQIRYRNIIKICLKVRFIIIPILVVFAIIPFDLVLEILVSVYFITYPRLLGILLIESSISIFLLVVGLRITEKNQQLQNMIDQNQLRIMKNQYLILIAVLLLRIGLGFWIVIVEGIILKNYFKTQNCNINHVQNIYQTLAISIIFPIFNHFIPIVIILRIFSVEEYQASPSLLIQPIDHTSYNSKSSPTN